MYYYHNFGYWTYFSIKLLQKNYTMECPQALLVIIVLFTVQSAVSSLNRPSVVASFAESIQTHSMEGHSSNLSVPLFYGWFFNESIAESISIIGKKYFLESFDNIPQFQIFVNDMIRRNNISNPLEYYTKPLDPDTQLPDIHYHTTAKFCGRNATGSQCLTYLDEVSRYLGRPYKMHLVGLFFTKNTFGIRVKLTHDEQILFREDDRTNSAQAVAIGDNETNNEVTLLAPNDQGFAYEPYYYNVKDGLGETNHPFYPGITFRPQKKNFHPTESRAHVTLGCAPHVEAVQTGLDLLEIIDLEVSSFSYHQDFHIGGQEIPNATLREYKVEDEIGSTAFVIYPTEEMIAEAVFDAYF